MRPLTILLVVLSAIAAGQGLPIGAHVDLYFPQFADGGDSTQTWQTTLTFVNPNDSEASVRLRVRGNDGQPLSVDLGSGLFNSHTFTVPPHGSTVLKSRMTSPTVLTGWVIATCSIPVQATMAFRYFANGVPQQEITAPPTLPGLRYTSFANADLGIAVANAWSDIPVSVILTLRDRNGAVVGARRITVPALGHTSFNLREYFSDLPPDFSGMLEMKSANPPVEDFVAWTMNADTGMFSALPSGTSDWPLSHWERLNLIYARLASTAIQNHLLNSAPKIVIDDSQSINAFSIGADTVQISLGMSELMCDSTSELAFVLAHELGHLIQLQTGDRSHDPNIEFDADIKATILLLMSGYDPYAGTGALAKLKMATGVSGLIPQIDHQPAPDANSAFSLRLDAAYSNLVKACADPDAQPYCQIYKSVIHPHFPDVAPLRVQPRRLR
jgi:hypothetical protein